MFNNRFNSSKNDPLIEAVKAAQHDGECRRQAEKIVNEEFGVYSRKAVVREQLAAYDAALDEVYTALKEGKKIDQDGDGDNDFADIMAARMKKSGKSHDQAVAATKNKPYNMEEGSGVTGEDPGMEVARKAGATQQTQTPSSTPSRTGNAAGETLKNTAAAIKEAKYNFERKQKGVRKVSEPKEADDYVKADERKPSKKNIIAKVRAKHMEEQVGQVSVAPKLSSFGSAFAAARKSGQSNFSFGGKSFNTKLASSPSTPKATPTMGRTPEAAASRTSGSSLPSMASATPAAKPAPAPVGKRDFASTLGRDVGSGPTIKPDAPKPPVDKFSFGQNIMNPPKADSSSAPSSTPEPSTPPVERGGSSNPPTTSASTATPPSGGAITQDAQKAQATTQDAGTPKPSARLQRIGESVEVGSNKYRIV